MDGLTILLGVIGAFGGISGILYLYQRWRSRTPKRLTWNQVELGIRNIKRDINRTHYRPDMVIGVRRSGAVVGGILAGVLGNLPITTVNWGYEWRDARRTMVNLNVGVDISQVAGLNLLIVDGRPRSGASVAAVIDELQRLGAQPRTIKTAALFTQRSIRHFEFDYIGMGITDIAILDEPPWRLHDPDYVNDYVPDDEFARRR